MSLEKFGHPVLVAGSLHHPSRPVTFGLLPVIARLKRRSVRQAGEKPVPSRKGVSAAEVALDHRPRGLPHRGNARRILRQGLDLRS